MRVGNEHFRTIWETDDGLAVEVIDQTRLPHAFATARLGSLQDAAHAIRAMIVRGAPLIGATAAYGVALAMRERRVRRGARARSTRCWRRGRPRSTCAGRSTRMRAASAPLAPRRALRGGLRGKPRRICDEDVAINRDHRRARAELIRAAAARKNGAPLNILTHCNAGWLACVDWGTALAPIYMAHDAAFLFTCGWTRRGRATRALR